MARKIVTRLAITAASAGTVVAVARAFGPLKNYALGGVRTDEVLNHWAVRLYRNREAKGMDSVDRAFRNSLDRLPEEKRAAAIAERNAGRKDAGLPPFQY